MFGVSKEWVEKRIHDFFDSEADELTKALNRIYDLEMQVKELQHAIVRVHETMNMYARH